jgi:xylose isomerase
MLVVEEMGGFTSGGVNFDAKTHRTSTDLNDIVRAHILGMDSYAAALYIARAFNRDARMKKILLERYESFENRAGFEFESNKLTLTQLASIAQDQGEPVRCLTPCTQTVYPYSSDEFNRCCAVAISKPSRKSSKNTSSWRVITP